MNGYIAVGLFLAAVAWIIGALGAVRLARLGLRWRDAESRAPTGSSEKLTAMNLLFGDLPRRRGTEALQRDAQRALAVVVVAGLTFIAILGILILIDSS